MTDLDELYQEVIVDHNESPRNFRKLEGATRSAKGFNPICGDQITVDVRLEGDMIQDIGFQGSGCAISKASASMMTESVKGKSANQVQSLFEDFHRMVTAAPDADPGTDHLGDLAALAGVRQFPARVKCASLAWHTLRTALEVKKEAVSTE